MTWVIKSRAENGTPTSTRSRRITVDTELTLAHYLYRCNFPSNNTLFRLNTPGREVLDAIVTRFGLKRTQVARQLLIWKKSKSMIGDHVFIKSSKNIDSMITDRFAISSDEIAHQTLLNIIPSKLVKRDSISCKFVLSQSNTKVYTYLRQLVSYLFVDNDTPEEKSVMRHKIIKIFDLRINPRLANYSNITFKINRGAHVPLDKINLNLQLT